MKRLFAIAVLGLFGYVNSIAQCVENPTNKIILAGDSWAAFMFGDQTLNHGLKHVGHSDKRFVSNVTISENGADTWDFVAGSKQDAIQDLVDANPEVEFIHMSIGGNDVLGDWHVSFTQQMTDSLENSVAGRLETIVDFLKSTRPGMKVFWPGYCYPNFEEVISELGSAANIHPFYSTWDDMGQPNFLQLNDILLNFSDSVAAFANTDPQMDVVHAQGILQHHYGQQEPLGVAPGGTYQPFEAPLPEGFPEYPSPKESMRLYAGIFTDCFHLSADAYQVFFDYQAERFYQKQLMDDRYELSLGGTVDGSVSSSGAIAQEIRIGEDNGDEIAAVLTFDVTGMPDTTLQGASIFLRRHSLTGNNPMTGNIQAKMINGHFGPSADVEAEDFLATGVAEGAPCAFGSHQEDGHWVRFDLTAEMLANINGQEHVQFIISVPGFTGGVMTFNDASDDVTAPVLNLNYGTPPNSVSKVSDSKEVNVYPVPTSGNLTIGVAPEKLVGVDVLDIMGKVIIQGSAYGNQLDISELPIGTYTLRITTVDGVITRRVIKR